MQGCGPGNNSPRANKPSDQQRNGRRQNLETQHDTTHSTIGPRDARAYGWRSVNRSRYRGVDAGRFPLSRQQPGRIQFSNGLAMFTHTFAFPRREAARVLLKSSALFKKRAQGRPGARCTRGLACKRVKKRTRAYRFSGSSPAFPAQWFYGLFRALPGDRAFLSPSLRKSLPANLTPASRRQDHTTSPSASQARSSGATASTASHPAFVTIAIRPSVGRDGAS